MFNQKLPKQKPQELRSESKCSTTTNMNNTVNMPVPSWGGEIRSAEDPNHSIKLINTCPIDNWITFIKLLSLEHTEKFRYIVNNYRGYHDNVGRLFQFIKDNKFIQVKLQLAKMNYLHIKERTIDFFGREYNCFLQHLRFLLAHNISSTCSIQECPQQDISQTFHHLPVLSSDEKLDKAKFMCSVNEWLFGCSTSICERKLSGPVKNEANVCYSDRIDDDTGKRYAYYQKILICRQVCK